jgi:hypothetical protein
MSDMLKGTWSNCISRVDVLYEYTLLENGVLCTKIILDYLLE